MIALIFPFQDELTSFLKPGEKTFTQEAGPLNLLIPAAKPDWRLAVCGQGKVEAALTCQILAERLTPQAFLLLGSATALDPALRLEGLVVSDPCVEWDFGGEGGGRPAFRSEIFFPTAPEVTQTVRSGPVLSGDRNVFDPTEKALLRERYQAMALAWEGAGFHRFLRKNRLTGWELRMITEEAGEGKPSLATLKKRLATGFPAVRKLIEALF